MLREDDRIRLQHMLDAAVEAVEYSKNRSREDMDSDRQLLHSLVRCIEIIGEAANKVSEEVQENNNQIPWSNIIGMRNRLIHTYYDVNLSVVWLTVQQELPRLIVELEDILG
jgi:uncharacterized protein with HEPN domain